MPKKPDLWMPWFIGDYLTDTTHLSRAEHGSYLLMLAHAWMHGGVLPTDDARLARIAHATAEQWAECRAVIMEFWTLTEAGYVQNRLTQEIRKAQRMVDQRVEAGKASARIRWGNESNENVTSVTRALHERSTSVVTGVVTKRQRKNTPPPPPSPLPSQSQSQSPAPSQTQNQGQLHSDAASAPARVNGSEAKTAKTWEAYSGAYLTRYGAMPLRNKKINGMLARFVESVPAEEAPAIASFYLRSNRGLHVSSKHCVELLLRDSAALHTEWVTGKPGTDTRPHGLTLEERNLAATANWRPPKDANE